MIFRNYTWKHPKIFRFICITHENISEVIQYLKDNHYLRIDDHGSHIHFLDTHGDLIKVGLGDYLKIDDVDRVTREAKEDIEKYYTET